MSAHSREFFTILLWASSVPVALIVLTVFTLRETMWRGYWFGIFLIMLFIGADLYLIEPTALTIGSWLLYALVFSIPNLVIYSIAVMILESLSWLLDKTGISNKMYNRSVVAIALSEALLAIIIISLIAMPVWGTISLLDWMRHYWWIFAGAIVLWIVFYLQRDTMWVKMNRSLN